MFGIVLVEMILWKRPTNDMFRYGLDIARYVEMNFPNRILDIVDPGLLEEHHAVSSQKSSVAMEYGGEKFGVFACGAENLDSAVTIHPRMSARTYVEWLQGSTESKSLMLVKTKVI